MANPSFHFFTLAAVAAIRATAVPAPMFMTLTVPVMAAIPLSASVAGVDSQGVQL
ncbi:hypothetical protein B0H11DRAFT_2262966 [Mycena galericulata]|nr:hypothetical protein B0H11DRAFT_2262966 [Mycena galericulata]